MDDPKFGIYSLIESINELGSTISKVLLKVSLLVAFCEKIGR